MATDDPILDIVIQHTDVPPAGTVVRFSATPEQCAALAARYELVAVNSLSGEVKVRQWRRHGLIVSGCLRAEIVQQCVVTLDDVEAIIEEDIDARFDPSPESARIGEDEDPPEQMNAGAANLGAIVEEFFALGIDPYPRKAGISFDTGDSDSDRGENGSGRQPFAALAALKPKGE